jgi:hypothetical protein
MDNKNGVFSELEKVLRGLTGKSLEIGILTGENPKGERISDSENNRRNEALYKELRSYSGARVFPISGNFEGQDENSFITTRVPLEALKQIATKYQQKAFIYGSGRDDNMVFHYMETPNFDEDIDYEAIQVRRTFIYKPNATKDYSYYKGVKFLIPFFDNSYTDVRWQDLSPKDRGEEEPPNGEINKDKGNRPMESISIGKTVELKTPNGNIPVAISNIKDDKVLVYVPGRRAEIWVDKSDLTEIDKGNRPMESTKLDRIKNIIESLRVDEKKQVKIKVKHPGILEVPEDKNFWQMPLKHFVDLVDRKSYAKISKALTNLQTWNENDDPSISAKAKAIHDKLKVKFGKEEK